jgi:hypothetical protein
MICHYLFLKVVPVIRENNKYTDETEVCQTASLGLESRGDRVHHVDEKDDDRRIKDQLGL